MLSGTHFVLHSHVPFLSPKSTTAPFLSRLPPIHLPPHCTLLLTALPPTTLNYVLRKPKHQTTLNTPNCQLSTVNTGCKQNDVRIVYTLWGNLKKTAGMDVGQVGAV